MGYAQRAGAAAVVLLRRGGSFTPGSLSSSVLKLWYDPTDLTTLKQNINGTTAVAADGDPVGYIGDKSGNAKHWVAAANDTTRPTYRTNNGRPYLEFDASNDVIRVASPGLTANTDILAAISRQSSNEMLVWPTSGGSPFAGTAASADSASASSGAGTPTYRVNGSDVAGGTATTRAQLLAALPLEPAQISIVGADLHTMTTLSFGLWSNPWGSGTRLYGYVACDASDAAYSATVRTNLETWLRAKVWPNAFLADGTLTTEGRWFAQTDANHALMATIRDGSRFRFTVTNATAVTLQYVVPSAQSSQPVMDVYVNGVASGTVLTLSGTVSAVSNLTIASGLTPASSYNIELRLRGTGSRWASSDPVQIWGVTGGTVTPWSDSREKVLFLGDSITGGLYARGAVADLAHRGGDICYGSLYCDNTNRSPIINGFSGCGVTVDGSFNVPKYWPGSTANSPAFYHMSGVPIGTENVGKIFVNLGQNDDGGAVDAATLKAAYKALIQAFQGVHPSATVYLMRPFTGAYATQISQVASELGVTYIDTSAWSITFSDGLHPDVAGHAAIAGYLQALVP